MEKKKDVHISSEEPESTQNIELSSTEKLAENKHKLIHFNAVTVNLSLKMTFFSYFWLPHCVSINGKHHGNYGK